MTGVCQHHGIIKKVENPRHRNFRVSFHRTLTTGKGKKKTKSGLRIARQSPGGKNTIKMEAGKQCIDRAEERRRTRNAGKHSLSASRGIGGISVLPHAPVYPSTRAIHFHAFAERENVRSEYGKSFALLRRNASATSGQTRNQVRMFVPMSRPKMEEKPAVPTYDGGCPGPPDSEKCQKGGKRPILHGATTPWPEYQLMLPFSKRAGIAAVKIGCFPGKKSE